MKKTEKLNNLKAVYAETLAEFMKVEKELGAKTETIPMYEGGSRYSMAGPDDGKIIGYREIVTYKGPWYLTRRNTLTNKLEKLRKEIYQLERANRK